MPFRGSSFRALKHCNLLAGAPRWPARACPQTLRGTSLGRSRGSKRISTLFSNFGLCPRSWMPVWAPARFTCRSSEQHPGRRRALRASSHERLLCILAVVFWAKFLSDFYLLWVRNSYPARLYVFSGLGARGASKFSFICSPLPRLE